MSSSSSPIMKDCCATALPNPNSNPSHLPQGREVTINKVPSYVVGQGSHYIVIANDAFGWEFQENRDLARRFANNLGVNEVTVCLPKLLNDPISDNFDPKNFPVWIGRNSFPQAMQWLDEYLTPLTAIKGEEKGIEGMSPMKSLQVTGYCYGGIVGMKILRESSSKFSWTGKLLVGVAMSHPGMMTEEDAKECRIDIPMLWNYAELDQVFPLPLQQKFKKILLEERKAPHCTFFDYQGVHHGFAVRIIKANEAENQKKEECTNNTVNFFKKNISSVKN